MNDQTQEEVERWFISRGLPHFIDDYDARDDILTRMVPFLSVVFAAEVILSVFGDRFVGWQQALVVAVAVVVLVSSAAIVNRVGGRSALHIPDRVGPLEIALFVVVPAVVAAAFGSHRSTEVPLLIGVNIALLVVAFPITSYGVVPMTGWVLGQLRDQIRGAANLMVRTLPLLLLFSAFLFLNAEVWQVANDFAWPLLTTVLAALVLIGSLFLALSVQTDVGHLNQFANWGEVCRLCAKTPLADLDASRFDGYPPAAALGRKGRFNVALVMFAGKSIQVALVAVATFAFYVSFGLLTVRESTISQWIVDGGIPEADRLADFSLFGHPLVLTRQLTVVAAFIAGFATLQFVVQLVTDAAYREQYERGMAAETRQALAVRVAYLACEPTDS